MNEPSILKDDEDYIPIGTAIARWAQRAFKAEEELDRLRAEMAELRGAAAILLADCDDLAKAFRWDEHRENMRAILAGAQGVQGLGNDTPLPPPEGGMQGAQFQQARTQKEGE